VNTAIRQHDNNNNEHLPTTNMPSVLQPLPHRVSPVVWPAGGDEWRSTVYRRVHHGHTTDQPSTYTSMHTTDHTTAITTTPNSWQACTCTMGTAGGSAARHSRESTGTTTSTTSTTTSTQAAACVHHGHSVHTYWSVRQHDSLALYEAYEMLCMDEGDTRATPAQRCVQAENYH